MTDYKEEQEGEVEALRSIYPEEELKGRQTLPSFRNLSLFGKIEHDCSAWCTPTAVIAEDPYCLEVKVSVEDSEIEGGQGKCVYTIHSYSGTHEVCSGAM